MSVQEHILIVVYWVVFGVCHSLFASLPVKRWAERRMGSYYGWYRPVYSIVAFAQTALILIYQFSIQSVFLWKNGIGARALFVVVGMAGLMVMAVSVKKYFFNLSGVQVFYNKKQAPVLETTGMHQYVRHPLYGGTLLFAWSIFLLFPILSYLLTCIAITAYTLIGIRFEEKKLGNLFGQQYYLYKNKVPMIVPFTKFGKLLSKAAPNKLS
jgi:methanethiol S-methyltransferase